MVSMWMTSSGPQSGTGHHLLPSPSKLSQRAARWHDWRNRNSVKQYRLVGPLPGPARWGGTHKGLNVTQLERERTLPVSSYAKQACCCPGGNDSQSDWFPCLTRTLFLTLSQSIRDISWHGRFWRLWGRMTCWLIYLHYITTEGWPSCKVFLAKDWTFQLLSLFDKPCFCWLIWQKQLLIFYYKGCNVPEELNDVVALLKENKWNKCKLVSRTVFPSLIEEKKQTAH